MKVIAHTWLVPVKAKIRFGNHAVGHVFGLKPDNARTGVEDGNLELHPIPDGIETFDAPDPQVKTAAPPKVVDVPTGQIEIPVNWDQSIDAGGLHHLQRVALAKKLAPDTTLPDGKWTVELADTVIRNEIQRRAAAVTPPAE